MWSQKYSCYVSVYYLDLHKYPRYLLAWDIVMEYHGLDDLYSTQLLFIILETKNLWPKCP